MDRIPLTIRVSETEKKMLTKRARRYGLSVNALIRFWVNSEPNSPRAFSKRRCGDCKGEGSLDGKNPCKKCQGAGYAYFEI